MLLILRCHCKYDLGISENVHCTVLLHWCLYACLFCSGVYFKCINVCLHQIIFSNNFNMYLEIICLPVLIVFKHLKHLKSFLVVVLVRGASFEFYFEILPPHLNDI